MYDLRNHSFSINKIKPYNQVFMNKFNFIPNLSILDLIFNLGPQSTKYLRRDRHIKSFAYF